MESEGVFATLLSGATIAGGGTRLRSDGFASIEL